MTVPQAPIIIQFDADVPKNAFLYDDPTRCGHCGVLTAPEYGACSGCPTDGKTYYCSRHCQSRDWEACHEGYCARKKFYAATRHLQLSASGANNTNLSKQIHDAADMEYVKMEVPDWYIRYLRGVPPAKRPAKLLGPSADYARKSSNVRDNIVRLAEGTTPDEHQARSTNLWQTTYAGKALGEIPFEDRPCYIPATQGGRSRRGIRVGVDDFEEISAEFFQKPLVGGSAFVDPWALTRGRGVLPGEADVTYGQIQGVRFVDQ